MLLARNDGHLNYFDALRVDGGRTYAFEDRQLHGSTEVAVMQDHGGFDQLLLGQRFHGEHPGFVYAIDTWAGTRGFAAGMSAKTTGRLFVAGTAAAATGALPLQVGDAPRELSLGYKLTPALTLSGGEFAAIGIPLSTFAAATLRTGIGSFGISESRAQTTFSASAQTRPTASVLSFDYNRTEGESTASLNAVTALRRGAIEAVGEMATDGSGDTTLQWRAARPGPSFVGGRRAHLVGRDHPYWCGRRRRAADFRAGSRSKRRSIRCCTATGCASRSFRTSIWHRHVATERIALHLLAPTTGSQVWIDGAPFARIKAADATLDIPQGSRTVSVRSLDGKLGSPTVNLSGRTAALIALPMWPIRVLRGRIVVEGTNPIDAQRSLEHTIVTLESSDLLTETNADGTFEMQPQPIPPSAVLRIEENSLPDAFSAGPAVAVPADGEIVLTIHARRGVERKSF